MIEQKLRCSSSHFNDFVRHHHQRWFHCFFFFFVALLLPNLSVSIFVFPPVESEIAMCDDASHHWTIVTHGNYCILFVPPSGYHYLFAWINSNSMWFAVRKIIRPILDVNSSSHRSMNHRTAKYRIFWEHFLRSQPHGKCIHRSFSQLVVLIVWPSSAIYHLTTAVITFNELPKLVM